MTGQHISSNPDYAIFDSRGFARDVRRAMDGAGLSQRQACTAIKVPLTAVNHARRGQPIANAHMLRLCQWMGRDPLGYLVEPDVSREDCSTCDTAKQSENKENSHHVIYESPRCETFAKWSEKAG